MGIEYVYYDIKWNKKSFLLNDRTLVGLQQNRLVSRFEKGGAKNLIILLFMSDTMFAVIFYI